MKAGSMGAGAFGAAGLAAALAVGGPARAEYVSPYATPYASTSMGTASAGSSTAGHATPAPSAGVVVVSCFRGPWQEVIWDHPEAVFLDSLRAVGYDYATAESIANRVCRDIGLVGNDAALKAEMERIVAESPSFRQF